MPLSLSQVKDVAGLVQAVATTIAIVIGGIWTYRLFVMRRQSSPHANIAHTISHRPAQDNLILLSVQSVVSNNGEVLLTLRSGRIFINQLVPVAQSSVQLVTPGQGMAIPPGADIVPIQDLKWAKGAIQLEPGESHQFVTHYLLHAGVQTIQVLSYFENPQNDHGAGGWMLGTVHDLA